MIEFLSQALAIYIFIGTFMGVLLLGADYLYGDEMDVDDIPRITFWGFVGSMLIWPLVIAGAIHGWIDAVKEEREDDD